ncbi:Beta-barrel assembly machine subunit BamB [Chitinasiproducens palmae]|uniref:Outer membrane protein assembly factor BamB n=1 Tax=Chitinasiproducens palmae TaxID=1770053 RepID=A0A1H2PVT4_9BURK|nr:Beta-barrel assembly machine subunit BamB [Chitinasiproducens palmae]
MCLAAIASASLLAACSSKDVRREPTPLVDFKQVLDVRQAWNASVGKAGRYLFQPIVVGEAVYAAGANGSVGKFDAASGRVIWRVKLDADLSAGVGSDGHLSAVGAINGDVIVLGEDGKQLWRGNVSGEILSAPLVGNGLVVVRTVDGRITAFNAQTGEQQWQFRNRAVPLNLRTTQGMIFAGQSAVLAGFPGGSLAAISVQTGDPFWQTPVSFPRGVTEVERINDVSGAPALVGRLTCAVTFQGKLGCFDVESGRPAWEQSFSSYAGLALNEQMVVAADDWSVLNAYEAFSGKRRWQNDQLKNRQLGTPAIIGRAVAVGDYKGFVHFLSGDDGTLIARMKTDGSAIFAQPVVAGQTLIVQTRDGDLYAFQPQ